ncbi:MAG: lytic transglycosylase domain-containing protein [Elusimicrobia bacterium]|nr:lytic transglycosylase domain-containing protein [Elusimicrobiota bacterium]
MAAELPASPAAPAAALRALGFLQTPGLAWGRWFDAAAQRRALTPPVPPRAAKAPAAPAGPYRGIVRRLLEKPTRNRYDAVIRRESAARGLDPRLVKSVIAAESEFTARARSRAGALGLMQLMPETADSVGVPRRRLFDPAANIRAGTRYLASLFREAWRRYRLGSLPFRRGPRWVVRRVLAAYNAGPRWVAGRPLYRQTRLYVAKVLAFYRSALSDLRG